MAWLIWPSLRRWSRRWLEPTVKGFESAATDKKALIEAAKSWRCSLQDIQIAKAQAANAKKAK